MLKTFKYRLFPTKKQLKNLETTLDECRWLYNHLLEMRKTACEQEGKGLSCYGQQATYPILKEQRPSLNIVHSQVLQNVAVRIDLAFKAFFRRLKAGEKPGYPRFRSADRYDSFCYPQSGFSIIHDERVVLSKIGTVKMVYHRLMKGKVKTATVQRSSTGKWYITFSVECEPERLPERKEHVGIDVGLKTFATLSNAEEIENPRFFRTEEKALAKVQRKHAKLAKGTPQRRKHRKRVARVHLAPVRASLVAFEDRFDVLKIGLVGHAAIHMHCDIANNC